MDSTNFDDYYFDDNNVFPGLRAKIEFEVDLIGKLIEAREQRGFTQAQLAQAAVIKQSAIARMESLKATPQIDTLFKVLMPLGYKLAIVPSEEHELTTQAVHSTLKHCTMGGDP